MIQNLSMILGFSKILFKEIGLFFFFLSTVIENRLHGRIEVLSKSLNQVEIWSSQGIIDLLT